MENFATDKEARYLAKELLAQAEENEPIITADLQNLEIYDNRDFKTIFQIDEFRRELLLEGLDEIGLTLRYKSEIGEYEKRRADWLVSVK